MLQQFTNANVYNIIVKMRAINFIHVNTPLLGLDQNALRIILYTLGLDNWTLNKSINVFTRIVYMGPEKLILYSSSHNYFEIK